MAIIIKIDKEAATTVRTLVVNGNGNVQQKETRAKETLLQLERKKNPNSINFYIRILKHPQTIPFHLPPHNDPIHIMVDVERPPPHHTIIPSHPPPTEERTNFGEQRRRTRKLADFYRSKRSGRNNANEASVSLPRSSVCCCAILAVQFKWTDIVG